MSAFRGQPGTTIDSQTPDLSDYSKLISPKRLRNPRFLADTGWVGANRGVCLCGTRFLVHRSTAISNWELLIQTACGQFLSRAAVSLAVGSKPKPRHAQSCVRRIGAIGIPTGAPARGETLPATEESKSSTFSTLISFGVTSAPIA